MQSPLSDVLIEQVFAVLADKRRVVLPQALSTAQWQPYLDLALRFDQEQRFRPARIIGKADQSSLQPTIRGDRILWLDDSLAPEIFILLQNLQKALNQNLYLGLTHFECHFACYEPGQGYDTHVDQRQNTTGATSERVISFVLYLNSNWQAADGGQLEIQLKEDRLLVEPQGGTLVLFDSVQVPHQVLAAHRTRWSLTGWFRRWNNLNHALKG